MVKVFITKSFPQILLRNLSPADTHRNGENVSAIKICRLQRVVRYKELSATKSCPLQRDVRYNELSVI